MELVYRKVVCCLALKDVVLQEYFEAVQACEVVENIVSVDRSDFVVQEQVARAVALGAWPGVAVAAGKTVVGDGIRGELHGPPAAAAAAASFGIGAPVDVRTIVGSSDGATDVDKVVVVVVAAAVVLLALMVPLVDEFEVAGHDSPLVEQYYLPDAEVVCSASDAVVVAAAASVDGDAAVEKVPLTGFVGGTAWTAGHSSCTDQVKTVPNYQYDHSS